MRPFIWWIISGILCYLDLFLIMYVFFPNDTRLHEIVSHTLTLMNVIVVIVVVLTAIHAVRDFAYSVKFICKSMGNLSQSFQLALEETQRVNHAIIFENHYALLLQQHNIYHEKICQHIDTFRKRGTSIDSCESDIEKIFNAAFIDKGLEPSILILTGNETIRLYMCSLYNLLNYISKCFYNEDMDKKKNHVSSLRSIIRNDVLYLIAVNGLNVIMQQSTESDYRRYQILLHQFDFFETAFFLHPFIPRKMADNILTDEIIQKIAPNYYSYIMALKDSLCGNAIKQPELPVIPALICIMIYKNPAKISAAVIIDRLHKSLLNYLIVTLAKQIEQYTLSIHLTKQIKGCCYRLPLLIWKSPSEKSTQPTWHQAGEYILFHFKRHLFDNQKNMNFHYIQSFDNDIRYKFKDIIENRRFYSKVISYGGIEAFSEFVMIQFEKKLKKHLEFCINHYNINHESQLKASLH